MGFRAPNYPCHVGVVSVLESGRQGRPRRSQQGCKGHCTSQEVIGGRLCWKGEVTSSACDSGCVTHWHRVIP
jgi:hypothetical protein